MLSWHSQKLTENALEHGPKKERIVFQPSIFGSELLRVGMSWQMGFVQWLVLGKDIKKYLDTNLKTLVFPMQACQRYQKRDL